MRVLLVEDSADSADILESYLRLKGCFTATAGGGEAALERMGLNPPDAVVTDHLMPGMTGFELVKAMRAGGRLAGVPAAIVSGLDEAEVIPPGEAASLGPTRFFRKPYEPGELFAWLAERTGKLKGGAR